MRIVFMGTPAFAATILEELAQQHEVVGVYTRPDAVRGRGSAPEASPVKRVALRHGLSVFEPRTLRDAAVQRELAALKPDVVCVAAYGAILPVEVLELPRYGCLNVHASLLPRWRGAAPVERAILAGDTQTGVCVMRMEEGLDTGAYCVCRTADIGGKSADELVDELADLGAHALLTALVHVRYGRVDWTEQDESEATYASKIVKGELDLNPTDAAADAARKVQASSAAHPSRAVVAGRSVTLLRARDASDDAQAVGLAGDIAPGDVRFVGKRLFLGMADGPLEILVLRPDGKRDMEARAFAAGVQGIKDGSLRWEARHG